MALTAFDDSEEFKPVVQLFRTGAGFQLVALFCQVASFIPRSRSISLSQAAVLAGYVPSDEELQRLQSAAARDDDEGHQIQQLVNWLNEDRQQVPSLQRQCRVVIRRQLSVAARFQSILPAIEQLGLPRIIKEYLLFDGPLSEVDLRAGQNASSISATRPLRSTAFTNCFRLQVVFCRCSASLE